MTDTLNTDTLAAIVAACANDEANAAQRAAQAREELAKAETAVSELETKAKADPSARTELIHARQELDGYRELYGEREREHEATALTLNEAAAHLQLVQQATDPALMTELELERLKAEVREALRPILFAFADRLELDSKQREALEVELNGGPVYAGNYPSAERHGVRLTHNREVIVNHPEGARTYPLRSMTAAIEDVTKDFEREWRASRDNS